jgi:hypothetical protein
MRHSPSYSITSLADETKWFVSFEALGRQLGLLERRKFSRMRKAWLSKRVQSVDQRIRLGNAVSAFANFGASVESGVNARSIVL